MTWIYLSPHFDDAVLSCGGLIWQQSCVQPVQIWTLCAGEIPPGPLTPFAETLHQRWQTDHSAVQQRRKEDEAACAAVGASTRYYTLPDCIYRRLPDGTPVILKEDDLWQPYPPGEQPLVDALAAWLRSQLPAQARLTCPLGVGGHIDHRLVRAVADSLGLPLWYYADYPYSVRHGFDPRLWLGSGYRTHSRPVSQPALQAWQQGIAAYHSQLSTFWSSLAEMHSAMAAYARSRPGRSLWRRGST